MDSGDQSSTQSLTNDADDQQLLIDATSDTDDNQANEAERIARAIIDNLVLNDVQSSTADERSERADSGSEQSLPSDAAELPADIESELSDAVLQELTTTETGENQSSPDHFSEFCKRQLDLRTPTFDDNQFDLHYSQSRLLSPPHDLYDVRRRIRSSSVPP